MGHQDLLKSRLSQANRRVTQQRADLLCLIQSIDQHFEAEQLVNRSRREGYDISRATIYRTLQLLEELNIVRKVHSDELHNHYEFVAMPEHHDHLICTRCGATIEFADPRIEALQQEVCQEHRFVPHTHRMEIVGLCGDCVEQLNTD